MAAKIRHIINILIIFGFALGVLLLFNLMLYDVSVLANQDYKDSLSNNSYSPLSISSSAVITEVAKLVASDREQGDMFSYSFDVDEDLIVIGDPGDNEVAQGSGAAYIFRRDNLSDNWSETKKFTYTLSESFEHLGFSVAISGTTIVLGTSQGGYSKGKAFIYEKDYGGQDNWGLVKTFEPEDINEGAAFGRRVDIFSDTVAISAFSETNANGESAGSVYIYERDEGGLNNWGQVKKLLASDGETGDFFGYHISLVGDLLFVHAENYDTPTHYNGGAIYLFERNRGGVNAWGELTKLLDINPIANGNKNISIYNDMALIGTDSNSAKLFNQNYGGPDNWGNVETIYGNNSFGSGVDIHKDVAVVGSPKDAENGYESGSANLFIKGNDSDWEDVGKILASDGNVSDYFGNQVAIRDGEIFISANQEDDNGLQAGALYIYKYIILKPKNLFLPIVTR